jgi:protein SCO1/2
MRLRLRSKAMAMTLAGTLLAPWAAQAHGEHDHHTAAAAARPSTVQVRVPDVALVDPTGRERKLKSEVMGERVVVVNFVFTTCTTVCPVSSAIFAQLQERLGAQLGRDVQLVSITLDPQRDTPARLKAYASKVGASPGWTWLTGRKDVVDGVLKSFGAYTTRPEDHPAMMLVGSARTGQWTRMYGFPAVTDVLAEVMQHVAECASAGPARPAARM